MQIATRAKLPRGKTNTDHIIGRTKAKTNPPLWAANEAERGNTKSQAVIICSIALSITQGTVAFLSFQTHYNFDH